MSLADKFMQQYGRPPTEFDPDYLEMLNMSKYRILDIPDKKQAKCANCGATKNDGRKYVDFGLEVDWYGIVFLCGKCLHDIAENMEFFTYFRDRIEKLLVRNKTLENLLLAQGDTIEHKLEILMEEVKEYFDTLGRLTSSNDSEPDSGAVVDDESSSGEPDTGKAERAASTNTGKATKSTASTGSKNVSSLAELLKY